MNWKIVFHRSFSSQITIITRSKKSIISKWNWTMIFIDNYCSHLGWRIFWTSCNLISYIDKIIIPINYITCRLHIIHKMNVKKAEHFDSAFLYLTITFSFDILIYLLFRTYPCISEDSTSLYLVRPFFP